MLLFLFGMLFGLMDDMAIQMHVVVVVMKASFYNVSFLLVSKTMTTMLIIAKHNQQNIYFNNY